MTKNLCVLYPADYLNAKKVDENFLAEKLAVEKHLKTALIDAQFNLIGSSAHDEETEYVYRGWMLHPEDYSKLNSKVKGKLIVSPSVYLKNHWASGWYPQLAEKNLTAKSHLCAQTDIEEVLSFYKKLPKKCYFIKDFVKSFKGRDVSPVIKNENELKNLLSVMQKYRGHLEGGVFFREVLAIAPNSEYRTFISRDNYYGDIPEEYVTTLKEAISCLNADKRLFYSLDLAKTIKGQVVVLEVGDGQVSDYTADSVTQGIAIDAFVLAICKLADY